MDYEKKYNDALNLAKSYYGNGCNEFLDTIFPELRESEDEEIRKHIIDIVKDNAKLKSIPCDVEIAYLEKQKEQKPVEWSDEDQNNVNVLLSIIGEVREMRMQNTLVGSVETVERKRRFDKLEAWLKSLRPLWKPSEEQLDMLCRVCSTLHLTSGENKILESLYKDLKKPENQVR